MLAGFYTRRQQGRIGFKIVYSVKQKPISLHFCLYHHHHVSCLYLPAFSISGADGCVHMSEEVRNAAWNIPRAFVWTLIINGTMAFAFMVVCLYCITDIDAVLDTPTGFPIIAIFYQATGSNAATTVLDIMMIMIQIPCSFCLLAAASRLAWSFSREHGFPGSKSLAKVTTPFKIE